MRLKLLRRRLTISAPRMAIRSALPWPLRWLLGAVVLGFSGALGLWAFEFGKDLAGLDRHARQELSQLRGEVQRLREDLAGAQAVAHAADSLLTTEKVAQEQLVGQMRQLQADNEALRNDLGFFERLIPGTGSDAPALRGVQVERISDTQIRWQALMIQPAKHAPEFSGSLEIALAGTLAGRPWSQAPAPPPRPVRFRSYLRVEGVVDVPAGAVVKTVTAKVLQGQVVKSVQVLKL
jgi:hypothetical protein